MHSVDATTEQMIRSVLAYAENRLRLDPVPLDQGARDPAVLDAALHGLLDDLPHNPDQVLGVYTKRGAAGRRWRIGPAAERPGRVHTADVVGGSGRGQVRLSAPAHDNGLGQGDSRPNALIQARQNIGMSR